MTASANFLTRVYDLCATGRDREASVAVIEHLDQTFWDGRWQDCDDILAAVDLQRLPSHVRRCFLAVTRPVKDRLPSRAALHRNATGLLAAERGAEVAGKMLGRLE